MALGASALVASSCGDSGEPVVVEPVRYNVLLLSVDDLGTELGCYGATYMHTPHIDGVASAGLAFTRAYCQQAVCGPSRASMLTGCRPQTHGVHDLRTSYRQALPDHVVLPELFQRNGWVTKALGKIHHGDGRLDDEWAWSEPCWRPERWQRYYAGAELQEQVRRRVEQERDNPYYVPRVAHAEQADVPAGELPDALIADEAIRFLGEVGTEPFFLAVGFLKPHLPFVAPRRYWELYPTEEIELDSRGSMPEGAPAWAGHVSPELRAYEDVQDEGAFSEDQRREFVRGYRACVSYVDAQIGRVLEALEEQGLAERTIVVVWGDHGWHLDDLGMFGKHTTYERAARAPLILSVPGLATAGESSSALVEFVDLYPTLAELCGLEVPEVVEGVSLAPLLEDPSRAWKSAAFSQYPRPVPGVGPALGRSLRTARHRVVEWTAPGTALHEVELYDYSGSPFERQNLAGLPEHAVLEEELLGRLHAGWRAALPPPGTPKNALDGE